MNEEKVLEIYAYTFCNDNVLCTRREFNQNLRDQLGQTAYETALELWSLRYLYLASGEEGFCVSFSGKGVDYINRINKRKELRVEAKTATEK